MLGNKISIIDYDNRLKIYCYFLWVTKIKSSFYRWHTRVHNRVKNIPNEWNHFSVFSRNGFTNCIFLNGMVHSNEMFVVDAMKIIKKN